MKLYCTDLYARVHQLSDLVAHKRVEVRVEAVDGSIDAHGDTRLVHLVEQRRDTGGYQMCSAP